MRRLAVCLVVALLCSCHQAGNGSRVVRGQEELNRLMKAHLKQGEPYTRGRLSPNFEFEFRGPLTIEQIEQETLEEVKESPRKDVPQVPFGFMNRRWLDFKEQRQRGMNSISSGRASIAGLSVRVPKGICCFAQTRSWTS